MRVAPMRIDVAEPSDRVSSPFAVLTTIELAAASYLSSVPVTECAGDFFAEGLQSAPVHPPDGAAEEEPDREAKGESGEDRSQGSVLAGMAYRKPAHAVKLTGANVLLYPHSRSESPVSEPNSSPGSSRLRWVWTG